MIKEEEYVSLELAKILKEKGFDEGCSTCYFYNGEWIIQYGVNKNSTNGQDWMSRPTLYEVQKWLREKHNIYIDVNPATSELDIYGNEIDLRMTVWGYDMYDISNPWAKYIKSGDNDFKSYENCLEKGIADSLNNIGL